MIILLRARGSNCTLLELKVPRHRRRGHPDRRSNCTLLELKGCPRLLPPPSSDVLIVPYWNWKRMNLFRVIDSRIVLIVPYWNWKDFADFEKYNPITLQAAIINTLKNLHTPYNENTMLFRKEFGNNQQCRSDGEPFGAGSGRNSALEKRLGNRSESIVGQIEWDSGLLKGRW